MQSPRQILTQDGHSRLFKVLYLKVLAVANRLAGNRRLVIELADVVVRAVVEAVARPVRGAALCTADFRW